MQALVASHPEIIADRDGSLLLIKREQAISDEAEGSGRWSLDHLFVTRSGVPVLVELKRASDTRLRREVVGQMLDYAANGTAYWRAGRIAESFAESAGKLNKNPDAVLAEFLGPDSAPEDFWQQVDANFAAGRIKLVFVADTIPRELARIVEFLNEQMRADVRAVELSWFESEAGITALAPRVIGETERAQDTKSARSAKVPISRQEWIDKHIGPLGEGAAAAAGDYIELIERAGRIGGSHIHSRIDHLRLPDATRAIIPVRASVLEQRRNSVQPEVLGGPCRTRGTRTTHGALRSASEHRGAALYSEHQWLSVFLLAAPQRPCLPCLARTVSARATRTRKMNAPAAGAGAIAPLLTGPVRRTYSQAR